MSIGSSGDSTVLASLLSSASVDGGAGTSPAMFVLTPAAGGVVGAVGTSRS